MPHGSLLCFVHTSKLNPGGYSEAVTKVPCRSDRGTGVPPRRQLVDASVIAMSGVFVIDVCTVQCAAWASRPARRSGGSPEGRCISISTAPTLAGFGAHPVTGGHLQTGRVEVMPAEVSAGVETPAGGQTGDEELGRRGAHVAAADLGRLVNRDGVTADWMSKRSSATARRGGRGLARVGEAGGHPQCSRGSSSSRDDQVHVVIPVTDERRAELGVQLLSGRLRKRPARTGRSL